MEPKDAIDGGKRMEEKGNIEAWVKVLKGMGARTRREKGEGGQEGQATGLPSTLDKIGTYGDANL